MSSASKYPIRLLLSEIISEHASCEADFITGVLGYRDVARGLRRLHLWTEKADGHQRIIDQFARASGRGVELERAITETREIKAKEWEAEWLEKCKAEAATFRPFLCAIGSVSIPQGICLFGLTGGFRKWTITQIPQRVMNLSVEDLLPALRPYMNDYKQKYGGKVPFFDTLTGFRFVRLVDYFQFDPEGNLVELVNKPYRLGEVSVRLT